MIFLIYLLHCLFQPVIHYYSVLGDDDLHRFVIEDGFKPAIFGSYSYDPVRQVFDPLPHKNTTAHGMSTKLGDMTTTEAAGFQPPEIKKPHDIVPSTNSSDTPEARLRQRMAMIAAARSSSIFPTTHWWARAIKSSPTTEWEYKNLTSLLNMI